MDENVGGAMAKPLLDKLGGGRRGGRGGEYTDRVKNVLCGSQDLVQTPSLNKCARQDTGHSSATAIPRGGKFLSLQNIYLDINFFSFGENSLEHFSKNIAAMNMVGKSLCCCHSHRPAKAVFRGPTPRDPDCIATVVRSAGI